MDGGNESNSEEDDDLEDASSEDDVMPPKKVQYKLAILKEVLLFITLCRWMYFKFFQVLV